MFTPYAEVSSSDNSLESWADVYKADPNGNYLCPGQMGKVPITGKGCIDIAEG